MSQQELNAVLKALVDRSSRISKHRVRTFRLTTPEIRALLRILTTSPKDTSDANLAKIVYELSIDPESTSTSDLEKILDRLRTL